MDLFSTGLSKYKNLSDQLTKDCELVQTEVNLLNKLLLFEQKFSDHLLNHVFNLYEKNFSNLQQNHRYFDAWNQLEAPKAIAKQNEIQVKKLRQELKNWRQTNHRLNDSNRREHSYSTESGTDPMAVVDNKTIPKTERPFNSKTQTSTYVKHIKEEPKDVEVSSSAAIKMEVIPKTEPDVCAQPISCDEDTDSAPECEARDSDNDCIIEGVEPIPATVQSTQPFLFVSEYLTNLMNRNKDQPIEDKAIAIDLNSDSEDEDNGVNTLSIVEPSTSSRSTLEEVITDSIFDDSIIDLTPKGPEPKNSSKKCFIRKRIRFGKKKKPLKKCSNRRQTTEMSRTSTSDQRIIGSNNKKIHFNPDNTISIIELKGSPVKKTSIAQISPNISPEPNSNASRAQTAIENENYIKSAKKIVLKGKTYYCRWKGCSYNTLMRGNAIRHHWTHTGEKPFKCRLCSKGFRDKRHLTKHVTTHSADQNLNKKEAFSSYEKEYCRQILVSMLSSEDSAPFRSAIDPNQCPHYNEVIEYPMDLTTVMDRFSSGFYDSSDKLFDDIRLIFANSKTYNTNRKSKIISTTIRLKRYFESLLQLFRRQCKSHFKKNGVKVGNLKGSVSRDDVCPYRKRGTGNVVCPECRRKYQDLYNMFRHMRRVHGKQKLDEYRRQNNIMSSRMKIRSKKLPKTRLKTNVEPISPKKFYKNSETDNLSAEEGVEENKEWKCDFMSCSRSYISKYNLKRHQLEIHKKLSKPLFYGTVFKCESVYNYFIPKPTQSIGKSLISKTTNDCNQPAIAQTTDAPIKAFPCNTCDNRYDSISGLYKHKKNVHKSKTDWSSCAQKANRFQNSTSAQHSDDAKPPKAMNSNRSWNCPEPDCASSFVWAKNLRTHLKEKHKILDNIEMVAEQSDGDSNETFSCTYTGCLFVATSRTAQITHYKTHFPPEDKPFKCLIRGCGYSAHKLSLLKYHVLNRHTEQQFFRAMEETGIQYPSWYG